MAVVAVPILTDDDLALRLGDAIGLAIEAVGDALVARAGGDLDAPPRWMLDLGAGRLVFTVGAERRRSRAAGFRVYDTFPDRGAQHAQIVAVFDADDGRLRGLVLGDLLGAIRTAAIDAVAIDVLARPDAATLGIVGTGLQAEHHLLAAVAVRDFRRVVVYSRDPDRRRDFADRMGAAIGVEVAAADTPEAVAEAADVLVLATTSRRPVVDASAIGPGMHVTTLGPKFVDAHELPIAVGEAADLVVTDSLPQVEAYPRLFFLDVPMVELADIVAGDHPGRARSEELTLFCSVGLAGTEVVVADRLLDAFA